MRTGSRPPPASLVDRLAEVFTSSGGDLDQMMTALVESPEFWSPEARASKIKSPFEVAASALRALEAELGFERLYVIGTPCSDNTTTDRFHEFLALLSERPETIEYLEFRADYHVELRFEGGRVQEIPFLKLPISRLPRDFFPLTCRTR